LEKTMARIIGPPAQITGEDDLRVRVEREIHGKSWDFDFVTPREQWETLFGWHSSGTSLRSPADAYEHAKPFWDDVAERIADALAKDAQEGAQMRTAQVISPNLEWLQDQYQAHLAKRGA
jgi:hypothetical protein